jgi:putative ABC transport system permease protein
MKPQFRTLVAHFFGRFFEVDSTSIDVDSRTRVIQYLALLSIPGLIVPVFMMGSRRAVIGDRYVFVAWAMLAMGLLMAFKWDSLFPDRRDYLILTSLPISLKRWFAAKVLTLGAFLSLFVVAINIFSLLLIPPAAAFQSGIHTPAAFLQAYMAHAAGTIGGSIFAALFFAALQGVLINILTPESFRRISPHIQMIAVAALVTLLLVMPLVKDSILPLAEHESPLLDYFPLMWFLGLYEALIPGGSVVPRSIVWAYTAMAASGILFAVFAVSYFVSYKRYSKKILESVESDTLILRAWKNIADRILDRTLLKDPVQRGTFHFIEKISGRSTKHRILTALYTGIGVALAVSSLFVLVRRSTSAFPFRLSTQGALEAPLIVAFVLISGLRATFNVPYELNANWIFQIPANQNSQPFLKAVRKWMFLYRIVPMFGFIALFEFASFERTTAISHLLFDLVIAGFLFEGFFFNFNKVPFTCSYSSSKMQLAALAAVYLYGFTAYIQIAGNLKLVITPAPLRMVVFLLLGAAVFALLESRRHDGAITYHGNDDGLLSLADDRGYFRGNGGSPEQSGDRHRNSSFNFVVCPRIIFDCSGLPPLLPSPRRPSPNFLRGLLQDFRYGSRILWKSPGLSATAVILIALVIGLNTTIYSIVHALITRPAPGVHARNLVILTTPRSQFEPFHSYPEYLEFVAQTKTLQSLVGHGPEPMTFGTEDGSYALFGSYVTPNYFEGLGVQIVRGRGFSEDDIRVQGSGLVAVISYRVWQEQFAGSPNVIGSAVTVNGHPSTVVGVAAPLFQGAELGAPDDVWVPAISYFLARGRQQLLDDRRAGGFGFIIEGQLKPGVSLAESQAEFATISARLQAAYPLMNKNKIVRPMPYTATINGGLSQGAPQFLAIFSVVTGLTLSIVCANVANLLLGRAVVRQRETAVRQSLGASRPRIVRTLVAEGVAISAVAWAVASLFSFWVSTYVPRLIVPSGTMNGLGMRPNHMNMDLSPDARVLAYAMLLAFVGTVFFCVAPAVRMWKQELLPGLKTGEHGVVRGKSKVASALVVLQLAFSVVLLTSAGLAYRSFSLVQALDLRFNKDNLLLVTVNPTLRITNRQSNLAFLEQVRERLQRISGVQAVSYVRLPPPYSLMRQGIAGPNSDKPIVANTNYVGPDYLRALGLAPSLGREFSAEDASRVRKTAIVNEDLARLLWPGESALGQTIPIDGGKDSAEIIGVTPNALFSGRSEPYFLFLSEQQDRARVTGRFSLLGSGETTFYVRYTSSLDSVGPAVRAAVRTVDERVPISNMRTMQTQLDRGNDGPRTIAAFLSLFSGGSLLIAAIGQYAVIAFEMRRRTRELGIRVAIGASARQIQTSVLKEGLVLTAIGLVIGFGLSLAAGFAFRGVLTGVTPTDARTYLGVFSVLAIASMLACYLPARRASRIDPLVTLRYE